MITFFLTLLFTSWTLCILWTVDRILIPLIALKIADWQWKKLHPDMPLHRRSLA